MEDILKRLSALEKRMDALEQARTGRAPLTWQQKADIKYDEYAGLKPEEVAAKWGVSISTVYKIFKERNAAEVEYERVTGKSVYDDQNSFLQWRDQNL